MSVETGLAVLLCLLNTTVYVGLLYMWRGNLPRDHPATIKRRLLSTMLACAIAWIPAYVWATRVRKTSAAVHDLLGLRLAGLPRAVADSLYLCVALFAGPLMYFMYNLEPPRLRTAQPSQPSPARPPASLPPVQFRPVEGSNNLTEGGAASDGSGCLSQRRQAAAAKDRNKDRNKLGAEDGGEASGYDPRRSSVTAGGGGGGGSDATAVAAVWVCGKAGDLRLWRNLVVAPLTEEFVFRACMVPLLKLQGVSNTRVVLLTPLFFGAAHLHHVAELVRHQGMALGRAAIMVAFQMAYTTVFGWLATYLFLRTGHLAAPVAAHIFCNWAGFPPFDEMAAHPRGPLLIITTVAGAATFGLSLARMTEPARYEQDFYGGW